MRILARVAKGLKTKELALKELLGHTRPKRGWFNAIGSVFKTIAGTLDANDAEYYNEAINKLTKNEKDLLGLLKQQTQVVQTTIHNFNVTLSNLRHNEEIFKKNFEFIEKYIESAVERELTVEENLKITTHFNLLHLVYDEIDKEFSTIISAILFARQSSLHPAIMTPHQYIDEIKKTIPFLPPGVHYPFTLDYSNAHELLNLINLQVYFSDNKLVYIIQNPLVNEMNFKLYKLISLPEKLEGDKYIFIIPSTKYIAISDTKQQYSPLDSLSACKKTSDGNAVCKLEKGIFVSHLNPICEIEFLQPLRKIPDVCDTRISVINTEIWYNLENKNKWIYLLPNDVSVTINCPNAPINDIVLRNSGILSLESGCKAYTAKIMIKASIAFESNYTAFVPPIDITKDDCCINLKENNLTAIKLDHSLSKLNLDNLELASHKLDQIWGEANEILKNKSITRHVSFFTYILYSFCVIVLLLVLWRIISCCSFLSRSKRNRRNNNDDDQNGGGECTKLVNCLTFNMCSEANPRVARHRAPQPTIVMSNLDVVSDDEEINEFENPPPEPRTRRPRESTVRRSLRSLVGLKEKL